MGHSESSYKKQGNRFLHLERISSLEIFNITSAEVVLAGRIYSLALVAIFKRLDKLTDIGDT